MSETDPTVMTPAPPADRRADRGLPREYRMRADEHYVEQLSSRRGDRQAHEPGPAAVAEPEARTIEPVTEPRERHDSRERRQALIATQLAEDLATIDTAARAAAAPASAMAQRVSLDLVRAHAWRAAALLQARELLDGTVRTRPQAACQLGPALMKLREGLSAESRLTGIALHVHASDWNASVSFDERELLAALTGSVIATVGFLKDIERATIKVLVASSGGELRTIDVSQEDVQVPQTLAARFFDAAWTDRPGGSAAALGAATARAVAQHHGGAATFQCGERRGCSIRLSFTPTA